MTIKEVKTYIGTYKTPVSIVHSLGKEPCLHNYPATDLQPASLPILESINRYYFALSGAGTEEPFLSVTTCFASRLALLLIAILSEGIYTTAADGSFSDDFYRHCLETAAGEGLADEIDDPEILIITIKQCLHMMAAAGILDRENARGEINHAGISEKTIHQRLFNSFWNLTPWEDIFPSDPEAARELRLDRNILKDLLARHQGAVSIESVSNEFFDMTGFTAPFDMEMISFLDFYFFSWLKHFGVIRYLDGPPYAPVRISITDIGRNILRSH